MRGVRDGGGMASLLALALFCFFHASCPVDGLLKCYCDICADTNYTCETDGYCFASTSLENDVVTYARRCFNQSNWLPPEAPRFCDSTPGIYRSRICCDKDLCNQNLYPVLLSPDSSELSSGILPRARDRRGLSLSFSVCLYSCVKRNHSIHNTYPVVITTLTTSEIEWTSMDFRNNNNEGRNARYNVGATPEPTRSCIATPFGASCNVGSLSQSGNARSVKSPHPMQESQTMQRSRRSAPVNHRPRIYHPILDAIIDE